MKKFLCFLVVNFGLTLSAFQPTIPVLHLPDYYNEDMRGAFLAKLEKALSEVGFFALTGSGVDATILDEAYNAAENFFSMEPWQKENSENTDGQRGYILSESAAGEKKKDFKEFYHIGREFSEEELKAMRFGKNIWPSEPEDFKPAMQKLYGALNVCHEEINSILSRLLGKDDIFLNQMTKGGDSLMRVIHYPAEPPEDTIWAAAHTDIDLFTILPRATSKGLQVQDNQGNWIDVVVPDDAFIINCGDMLENMTNGVYRSSVHRVVDPQEGNERYSIVFFVHPKEQERLDPLDSFIEKTGGVRKYANVTRLELLAERLIDLGLASKELKQFFVESGAIERLQEVGRFSPKAEKILIAEELK